MQGRDPDPAQNLHALANGREHAADFALLAFRQDDSEPGARAVSVIRARGRRRTSYRARLETLAVTHHAAYEAFPVFPGEGRVEADEVLLLHLPARMCQKVGQVPVVGEDEEALAVEVEPADGVKRDSGDGDEVEDRGTAHLVARRSDEAKGLVEGKV